MEELDMSVKLHSKRNINPFFLSDLGSVNGPSKSCDLMLLHILWGYFKAHVYREKPAAVDIH